MKDSSMLLKPLIRDRRKSKKQENELLSWKKFNHA